MTQTLAPSRSLRVALVGNPNVGKTSLFNALTGLSARVGNYAGVTVEKKVGQLSAHGRAFEIVDLPGIYTLAPHSPDEIVAFDVLARGTRDQRPDAVVVLLDASNLERNLYLYSQVAELGLPLVVALTMTDVAAAQGLALDPAALEAKLGVPVLAIHAGRGQGLDALKAALAALDPAAPGAGGAHGWSEPALEAEAAALHGALAGAPALAQWPAVWLKRALVDEGGHLEKRFLEAFGEAGPELLAEHRRRLGPEVLPAAHEARARYAWVRRTLEGVLTRPAERTLTLTDRLDAVLTHPVLGLAVFAGLMALIFQSLYTWSAPLMDGMEGLLGLLGGAVGGLLPEGALRSLLVDGVIAGIGSVVIFLPQIAILFLFVHLLEDCGYMARAAFMMDRVMSKAGLSGKSFIPMLSGFACAVPSIMATRTIENRRDRFATILALPLMSCSARLPVYTLLIGAFVPAFTLGGLDGRGLVLFGVYAAGIVFAVLFIWLLKRTVLRGETPPILLELPSYKLPHWRVVGLDVWRACREFLTQAGTVILLASMLIWAGAYFPHHASVAEPFAQQRQALEARGAAPEALAAVDAAEAAAYVEDSYLARAGKAIQPAFTPLGWDWRITTGVLASFPAREVIVATLGTLYSLGSDAEESALRDTLQSATGPDGQPAFTLAVALSVMVFFALCLQCVSTLSVMARETGSWKWPAGSFVFQTLLAYVCAFAVYQLFKGV